MKVMLLVWTLWTLNQDGSLGQVIAKNFPSGEECVYASVRLAFLTGQESRCMGPYRL